MARKDHSPKESKTAEGQVVPETEAKTPVEVTAGAAAGTEIAPVEGEAASAAKTKKEVKPAKPEDEKKGNRICASCEITEQEMLAKNPRYSLCKGVCVNCYRKGDRVYTGTTVEAAKVTFPNAPEIKVVGGTGIMDGVLVKGALKPVKPEKPAPPAAPPTPAAATGTAPAAATNIPAAKDATAPTS